MKHMRLASALKEALKDNKHAQVIDVCAEIEQSGMDYIAKETILSTRLKLTKVKNIPEIMWSSKDCYAIAKELKLKHLYKIKGLLFNVDNDPIRSVNYTLLNRLLHKTPAHKILHKYQIYSRMHDFKDLKALASYMKNNGPDADIHWMHMVDIDTLWGWRNTEHGDEIVKKIEEWVVNKFKPNYCGSESDFNTMFREEVRKILRWRVGTESSDTIEEFCSRIPEMGTTGSAYDPAHRGEFSVLYEGKPLKLQKNKYSKALSMTVAAKVNMLKTSKTHNTNVSLKQELYPKVRTIVSLEFSLAEQQRYIDTWLRKWMRGNPLSTLWSTPDQKLEMWRSMATPSGVNVPIDQSAFDVHVSKTMVQIINEELLSLITDFANNDEMILVMSNILEAMKSGTVHYQIPGGKRYNFPYENGVLSGWQFTAFYDTITNIAEMRIAERLLTAKNIPINTLLENCQGDDQLKRVKTWAQAIAYWAAMASLGLEINLAKNFFSDKHNEYLRKYAEGNEVNGYITRIINGICWVYPGSKLEYLTHEKINNITSIWTKVAERLKLTFSKIREFLYSDAQGAKINLNTLKSFLTTPKALGGLGLEQGEVFTNQKITLIQEKTTGHTQIEAPGYTEFEKQYGEFQHRELKQWVLNATNATPAISEKEQLEESIVIQHTDTKPQPFVFSTNQHLEKPARLEGWPDNLIFGSSDELFRKLYKEFDAKVKHYNAPKAWVKDWLAGKLKTITPRMIGYSEEFASMIFTNYRASMLHAMLRKRQSSNKWERLQLYAEQNFDIFFQSIKAPRYILRG